MYIYIYRYIESSPCCPSPASPRARDYIKNSTNTNLSNFITYIYIYIYIYYI